MRSQSHQLDYAKSSIIKPTLITAAITAVIGLGILIPIGAIDDWNEYHPHQQIIWGKDTPTSRPSRICGI